MHKLERYDLKMVLDVEGKYTLYQGINSKTNEAVIIKTVNHNDASIIDKAQLHHEFELLLRLTALSPHVLQPIDYIDSIDGIGLALHDHGAKSLHEWFGKSSISVDVFLPLAVKMAQALSEIHEAQLIHRNLTLKNILYNMDTQEVYISDFSLATELKRVMTPNLPPKLLQGSLEYMAPEQTGRLNRPLTRRADLYSMGIIFYKLLTGHLPFESNDPFIIIRGHLDKEPKSIDSWIHGVPDMVSSIVMKLLAKMPQDRYRSAAGLKYDLEYCYHEYQNKKIPTITLALHDKITHLELPDRLYGREEEINSLFSLFDNLCATSRSVVLSVSGHSGVGKTSLVKELSKKVAVANGFFVNGKFDVFQQSDTYEGLSKALDKLVQYYMGLPEEEYQNFRYQLLTEIGPILRVITDLIPRLKFIVGEPEQLPDVGPEQTRNRFQLALHKFVKIAGANRPIVLLLDDMQWANESMFQLLEKLTTSEDIKNIFFIICYRNDEIHRKHPALHFLDYVRKKKEVYSLDVAPLNAATLSLLLQDILYLPEEEVSDLTVLMSKKTEGNPFFFLLVLEELYRDNLICFDSDTNRWMVHNKNIKEFMQSDNVVDFIDKILLSLPEETRDILHIAACVGNTFLMEELVVATKQSPQFLSRALFPAMKANIVLPLNLQDEWMTGIDDNILLESEYRFIHDKIQQGAYHLKSINETKKIHLNIARGWYSHYTGNIGVSRAIAIADQFDKGLVYVVDNNEKKLICELNYKAGQLVLASVAHERAFYYGNIAVSLLTEDSWQENYQLTFDIYFLLVSSAFLSHRFEVAEMHSKILLENTKDKFEKARILLLKSNLYRVMNKTHLSIAAIKEALTLYNYEKIVKDPSIFDILLALIKTKYNLHCRHTKLSTIKAEISMQDRLLYLLVQNFSEELYLSSKLENWVYALLTWFNTTYESHNSYLRAVGYMIAGVIWPHSDYLHKLVNEAKDIVEEHGLLEHRSTLYCIVSILHMPWHSPIYEVLPLLRKSFHVSAQAGNLDFLSFTYQFEILFNHASSLPQKLQKLEENGAFVKENSMRVFITMKIHHQFFRNLSGDAKQNCWNDEYFNLEEIKQYCQENNYAVGSQVLLSLQLATAIHFHDYKLAENINAELRPQLRSAYKSNSYLRIMRVCFFSFMAEAVNYQKYSFANKMMIRLRLRKIYRHFEKYSATCPSNFLYMFLIMQAEMEKIKNNDEEAIVQYDNAVIEARKNQHPEFAGFALERMALLHLEHNHPDKAERSFKEACKIYDGWGASGKMRFIRNHYHV